MFEIKFLEDEQRRFFVISYSSELIGTAITVSLDSFIYQLKDLNKSFTVDIHLDNTIHVTDSKGELTIFPFESFSIEASEPIEKINTWFYQFKSIRENILYKRDFTKFQLLNVYSF